MVKKTAQQTPPGGSHILAFLAAANTDDGQLKINELVNQLVGLTRKPLQRNEGEEAYSVEMLKRCAILDIQNKIKEFNLMVALVQLRLELHR